MTGADAVPAGATAREAEVWRLLESVRDPELPLLSILDLGLVRNVEVDGNAARVQFTPTFSGCPALRVIADDIERAVRSAGFADVTVRAVLAPPWTSDAITSAGRAKLRELGIAPPGRASIPGDPAMPNAEFVQPLPCPYCGSDRTIVKNAFGPTLCKAIFWCDDCSEPFEGMKSV